MLLNLIMKKYIEYIKKFIKFGSKILFFISVVIVIINLFSVLPKNNATVSSKTTSKDLIELVLNKVDSNTSKEGKKQALLYRQILCASIGDGCYLNDKNHTRSNFNSSVFGLISNAMNYPLMNPPSSGVSWTILSLKKAGLISKTYAYEGIGFASIKPLSAIWEVFRNIAFGIIVIVILAIGFMIMFRVKINPQTMISIENSLPRIVVALLLITFSFAISGFLIDLMYVILGITISILTNNGVVELSNELKNVSLSHMSSGTLFNMVFWNGGIWETGPALFSIVPGAVNIILRYGISILTLFLFYLIPPVKKLVTGKVCEVGVLDGLSSFLCSVIIIGVGGALISGFSPYILSLVIFITTAMYVFFRILFLLLTAYLRLLFMIMFSPIILLFEAIPGRNIFIKWLKGISADLLLFPITVGLIYISAIIFNLPIEEGTLFQAPLLYSVYPHIFNVLLGMGLLFAIPTIGKNIRGLFGIKESPFKIGIGTYFAGTTAIGKSGMQTVSQVGQLGMYGPKFLKMLGIKTKEG